MSSSLPPAEPDSISTIELELTTLVRHLDTLGRRGSLYAEVDRAGYLALRTLVRLGPVATTALADALHLDASTVTRQLNALARSGFVRRGPNPSDRRSSTLTVTPAGLATMRRVERERRRLLQEMFRTWSERDRRALGTSLTRLNATLVERVSSLG